MKLSYKLLCSLLVITNIVCSMDINIVYSMDNTKIGKVKKWKLEVLYTSHYAELNSETQKFVDIFNTWPQMKKDKIQIIKKNNIPEYMVIYDSIKISKYNGPIIDYLNYHLENDKIVQFKWVIKYLKQYQYSTQPKKRTVCTMIPFPF